MSCHAPHSAPEKNNLQKKGRALCLSCHEEVGKLAKAKHTHQPFASGECSDCHAPHATDHRAQLIKAPAQLCASCHNVPKLRAAHQGYSLFDKADCVSCHDPHGSPEKGLVRAAPHQVFRSCAKCHKPGGELVATGSALCFRCHSEKRVELSKPGAHEGSKGDCLVCHTPHAANDRNLSAGPERAACLACHDTIERTAKTSRTIHPLKAEKGKCSICHEPHQTEVPRLLRADGLDLCRKCHASHASFGHPVGPNVIDKRTSKPVTCLSCHGPHGTQWGFILLDNPSQPLCIRCHDAANPEGMQKAGVRPASMRGPAPR
jgi:predicted CXXCH cytochrome family protein